MDVVTHRFFDAHDHIPPIGQDVIERLPFLDERSDVLIDGGHFFCRKGDATSGFREDGLVLFLGFSGGVLLFLEGAEMLSGAGVAYIGSNGQFGTGLLFVSRAIFVTAGTLAAKDRIWAFATGRATLAVGPVQAIVERTAKAAGATKADASTDLLGNRGTVLTDRSADDFERHSILDQLLNS